MTTITIERELLERVSALLDEYDAEEFDSATVSDVRAALPAPATAPEQPSWHDAPTCAGLWLSEHDNAILTTWRFSAALFERGYWTKPKTRWYGPIPEDKQ